MVAVVDDIAELVRQRDRRIDWRSGRRHGSLDPPPVGIGRDARRLAGQVVQVIEGQLDIEIVAREPAECGPAGGVLLLALLSDLATRGAPVGRCAGPGVRAFIIENRDVTVAGLAGR